MRCAVALVVVIFAPIARAQDWPDLQAILLRNERALLQLATGHHAHAADLRKRAGVEHRPALLNEARQAEERALMIYGSYLIRFPNSLEAYEVQHAFAEAAFLAGNFRDAADAYARVRDSTFDDRYRIGAALSVVAALEHLGAGVELQEAKRVCLATVGAALRRKCTTAAPAPPR